MKIKELREGQPLEVVEVAKNIVYLELSKLFEGEIDEVPENVDVVKRIQMKIFTDGEIDKETDEITKNIDEYYLDKRKYQSDVDTLKTKNIYFKNYSYVIVYLLASEVVNIGNINDRFDVIKDVSIYLNNSKDKDSLRNAKNQIKEIEKNNNIYNYSSLFGLLFSKGRIKKNIELEELRNKVYTLKKTNKF